MNVLITGGSKGIGEACVRYFADNGAHVLFTYCQSKDKAQELAKNTNSEAFYLNYADINSIHEFCSQIQDKKIDVLVNNIGVSYIGLFQDMKEEEILKLLQENLTGHIILTKNIIPQMITSHNGAIVNIGSMWGRLGASCEVIYSTAKAGIVGFTKSLAKELGPCNIRVNCVEPGVIMTDMNKELSLETLEELKQSTALNKLGSPLDIAKAVYFLSTEQSSYITGQILAVDGGFYG